MEKEKVGKPKSHVTANNLMDYVEEQLEKHVLDQNDMDKIIKGLWVEKTKCTVREHLTFDDVRGSRMMHCNFADAMYELLKLMNENDLTLQDLECYPYFYASAYPNPIISFAMKTKEHSYEYYPIMLYSQWDCEKDEYIKIKNAVAHMQASYCDLNNTPEENG